MTTGLERLPADSRQRLRPQEQPRWLQPTLATLVHAPFGHADWLFEPKLDGERCLVFKQGAQIRILSRNNKPLNETYPELVEAFAQQSEQDFVLDGEIVAFDGNVSSFARLQNRMQLGTAAQARAKDITVRCYLFDVLYTGGYDVRALPLRDRKKLLSGTLDAADPLRETTYRNADGEHYYRQACQAGWEGVLAKDATSAYAGGRSRTWLKFKCVNEQELVVGGFTEPAGSRAHFGALLVGYYEQDRLVYAGKVGTGFSEDTLRDLGARLTRREQKDAPFVDDIDERDAHWVRPELVAQIAFTAWTTDGKLRHPSYRGLRDDKTPREVGREKPS